MEKEIDIRQEDARGMVLTDRHHGITQVPLFTLFFQFMLIGAQAFGGHFALVAQIQTEVVDRRRWLSLNQFNQSVGFAMLLPGPMAVNVVSNIGFILRGWAGALFAIVGVLTPAFILVVSFAAFYHELTQITIVVNVIQGLLVGVSAIVAIAGYRLCSRIKSRLEFTLLFMTALLFLLVPKYASIGVIFVAMAVALLLGKLCPLNAPETTLPTNTPTRTSNHIKWRSCLIILLVILLLVVGTKLDSGFLLLDMVAGMAANSVMLFGGAFSFIPIIGNLVVDQGWLSAQAFADAVTVAQFTPGPILISSAFIGFQVAGLIGAFLATLAIFLPTAIIINVISRWAKQRQQQGDFKHVFIYVTAVIAALVTVSCLQLMWLAIDGHSHSRSAIDLLLFALAVVLLVRIKLHPIFVVAGCGLATLLLGTF